MDLRPGGRYRLKWKTKEDRYSEVVGRYREIRVPEKLVFTWEDKDLNTGETIVTVEFFDRDGSTELSFTHEGLVDAKLQEAHHYGWTTSFDLLQMVF